MKHRNSQKRIYVPDGIYFITMNTFQRYPYFKEVIFCKLFIEELKLCKFINEFKLYAFSIIYDHVHLLLKPTPGFNVSKVVFSIKKQFAHDMNRVLGFNPPKDVSEQTFARLREINEFQAKLSESSFKFTPNVIRKKFRWQSSFHDHIIRDEHDFQTHLDYIDFNPEKHKLPKNWPFIYTNIKYQNLIEIW